MSTATAAVIAKARMPWLAASTFTAVARPIASSAMSAASSVASVEDSTEVKRSYLIWEDGFAKKFFISAAVLSVVALGAQRSTDAWLAGMALQSRFTFALQTLAHRFEWWSVLGLLSSSCCVLQLMLNAMSFGCAGFNTVLGPLRPAFLALTLFLQACVWRTTLSGRGMLSSAVGGTLLCFALTFLPEALHLYVHRRRTDGATAAAAAASGTDELCLRVGGMGCTACTAKVQGALEAIPGVASCEVVLESGSARLRLEGTVEGQADGGLAIKRQAVSALEAAGFEASPAAGGGGTA